jgi:hypothetical protein
VYGGLISGSELPVLACVQRSHSAPSLGMHIWEALLHSSEALMCSGVPSLRCSDCGACSPGRVMEAGPLASFHVGCSMTCSEEGRSMCPGPLNATTLQTSVAPTLSDGPYLASSRIMLLS